MNQYDGAVLDSALQRASVARVPFGRCSDIVVVNTCCVTKNAMSKTRRALRRALRGSPQAAVLVAGCYCDYDRDAIVGVLEEMNVPAGRFVLAPHKKDWQTAVEKILKVAGGDGHVKFRGQTLGTVEHFQGHQRAFVKVQDGCDAFCTYCIVPRTRSKVFFRPPQEVEQECRALVASGHKEIVLAGVFLGAYGRDTTVRKRWDKAPGGASLAELVKRISSVDGLWRLRLSSLEPGDVTDELLAACSDAPDFAPHFHLPLQSGSDGILKKMNRQYTAAQYRRAADKIRRTFDHPAITTDVIVGFPFETEDDFEATLEMVRYSGFSRVHIFPFSPVPGTAACRWRKHCPSPAAVKGRHARLQKLSDELAGEYRRRFIGDRLEALVESPRKGDPQGARRAMTDRYIRVFFPGPQEEITGRVVGVKITGEEADGLSGEMLKPVRA